MVGLVSGCAKYYYAVGSFADKSETFTGTIDQDEVFNTLTIGVEGQASKTRCVGKSDVENVGSSLTCIVGQHGIVDLACNDGRIVRGRWRAASCSTGFGNGRDQYGNAFTFAFSSAGQAEANEMINRQLADASKSAKPKNTQQAEVPRGNTFQTPEVKTEGQGTGFFVTNNGYIITNYHVVESAKEIVIIPTDGIYRQARIVRTDPANDLAVLKVEMASTGLWIRDSGSLSVGEEVFTTGYPLPTLQGRDQKTTFGRINSLSGLQGDIRFVQIDVPVQPGNSGGPLVDSKGRVVGIVTGRLNDLVVLKESGSLPQNVNYAVKSDYMIPLLRPYTQGSWRQTADSARTHDLPSLVKTVQPSVVLVIVK